jgi:hypothetical protein
MSRFAIRIGERGLGPPQSRRALGLAIMITCAVAAVSFTVGLVR